jgi:large subunit ribosomal protein L21
MAYAVVETGGKQYITEKDLVLDVEKLNAQPGQKVKLDKVLFYAENEKIQVGKPYLEGAFIEAEVIKNHKLKKVISFKKIRREGSSKKKIGHRQEMTRVKIVAMQKGK